MSFQQDALRTESRPETLKFSNVGLFNLLGLFITASEVADTAKRAIFYGKPLDKEKFFNGLIMLRQQAQIIGDNHTIDDPVEHSGALEPVNLRLLHTAMGIFGEAGELLEALRAQMSTGKLDLVNVAEELGDIDWYKAIGHDATGVTEEDTRAKVIAKLKARYPNKFDSERAHERDLAAERKALEETTAVKGAA